MIDPRASTDSEIWRIEMLRLTDAMVTLLNGGTPITPGGEASTVDAATISAGVDGAEAISSIAALLSNVQVSTPTLYTDASGVIFAPETILNPASGTFVRGFKTFPAGVPYAPQGAVQALGQSSYSSLQSFTRIVDSAEMFGSYDPSTQMILPYLGDTPIAATGWVPTPPGGAWDSKVARLELPNNGAVIAAGTAIAIDGPNLGMLFEGSENINLGSSASAFALAYPSKIKITIAGLLADENEVNWLSPTAFSYSQEIWPGADIVIQYQEFIP